MVVAVDEELAGGAPRVQTSSDDEPLAHRRDADWRTSVPGTAAVRHLVLSDTDEEARVAAAPSQNPGYCVDELCSCARHKCVIVPPRVPFDADTTYRVEYKKKEVPRPLPPVPVTVPKSLPFDADSAYRTDYKKWPIPARQAAPASAYQAPPDGRDFTTESRANFDRKELPRPLGLDGRGGAGGHGVVSIPDGRDFTTESRANFDRKELPRPLGLDGRGGAGGHGVVAIPDGRDFTTESRANFDRKELPRPLAGAGGMGGVGDGRGGAGARIPFEGTSTYRTSFKAHDMSGRAAGASSLGTGPGGYTPMKDNRDFCTEYRGHYKGKIPEFCPVTRLPPYPAASHPRTHTFWDPQARQWY